MGFGLSYGFRFGRESVRDGHLNLGRLCLILDLGLRDSGRTLNSFSDCEVETANYGYQPIILIEFRLDGTK